jgi:hypothetical protein
MNAFLVFRYFWLIAIAVTLANALILKIRSQDYIRQRPELARGYSRLFWGVLFFGNLPWFVMGLGIEFGGVANTFSYFRPRDGNPFVLGFFGVVVLLWILGFYWIFVRQGAEFLIEHPGLFRGKPKSSATIKLFYCLGILGGIVGVIMMLVTDMPNPFPK